jgi:MFS family permease
MNDNGSSRLVALIVTTISSFLTPFMAASVIVALPSIGREFRMDPVFLSWVVTAFLLGVGVFLIPMGRLADIIGRKKVYLTGLAVFGIMSLICAGTRSGYTLVLCRFFQGAGAAMTFGPGIAILTSIFPPAERGKALGINIGTVYLGMSLGPFLGGILTDHLGWRYIFLLAAPMTAIIIAAVLLKLKQEWADARGETFDRVGAFMYGGVLIALICGITWMPSLKGLTAIVLGAAGIALFVRWEKGVTYPMLDIDLFRGNRLFAFSNLAGVINYAATYAVAFLLSLYLQSIRAMSAQAAGVILVSQPLAQGIVTIISGKVSDTMEPRTVASVGMAITVVCLLLFSFLSDHTAMSSIVVVLAVLGFGFALFAAPNANAVMAAVSPKYLGVASGTLICTGTVGQILSMGITSLVFAIYVGRVGAGPLDPIPLLGSMKLLFMIFALVSIAGFFVSLARGKVRRSPAAASGP